MKDYVFMSKKREQNILNSLNFLIYDYLVKMKYEKTAKIFVGEAYLEDVKLNEAPPILSQWYSAFQDISNVRCGLSNNLGDLARIEGIMLKLENEKKRYQQMGKMDNLSYFNMTRGSSETYKSPNNMHYTSPYHPGPSPVVDPRRQVDMRNMHIPGRPIYNEQFPLKARTAQNEPILSKGVNRFEEPINLRGANRFDPNSVSISPKMFEQPNESSDKKFYLRNINSFKITDKNVLLSVLSQKHNILFSVFDNKTIGSFNCNTFKNECIVETNGKQIIKMRIKDDVNFIWLVASFDTNDLMVIRYLVQEVKFEMAGYLRGHAEKIACFDVADYIYSIDNSGSFKKWNFKGICEKEEIFNGNIKKVYYFAENCLILSDANRTYLYNYTMNMEISEISKGLLLSLKKQNNYYLLVFADKVVIHDNNLNKIKILTVPNSSIKNAIFLDSDVIIGSLQCLWFETQGRLNKCKIYEHNEIVTLKNISRYKPGHILVLSNKGECVIMSKCFDN